jgi:hypothetical protein
MLKDQKRKLEKKIGERRGRKGRGRRRERMKLEMGIFRWSR